MFCRCAKIINAAQQMAATEIPSKTIGYRPRPTTIGITNEPTIDPSDTYRVNKTIIRKTIPASRTASGEPIFDYSLTLANPWRIGSNGRGVLFLLSINDRKWRIQVTRALESVLTNDVTKSIGDKSTDFFKRQEYAAGVESFVRDLDEKLAGS